MILMVSWKISYATKTNDNLNQLHVIIATRLTAQLRFWLMNKKKLKDHSTLKYP